MLTNQRFIFFLLFAFIGLLPLVVSGSQADSIRQTEKPKTPLFQARELMKTQKNAEALDVLVKYGRIIENELKREQDSLVETIKNNFRAEQDKRLLQITEKEHQVAELKSGNAGVREENLLMTTNTMFFFGILIGLIVLILFNRFNVLVKAKKQLIHSEDLLSGTRNEINKLAELEKTKKEWLVKLSDLKIELDSAKPLITGIHGNKQHPLHKPTVQLLSSIQSAIGLLSEGDIESESDTFVQTDLNALIEDTIVQSYFSMKSDFEGFECTIVKDLEKILPAIEVIQDDIRFVLFNLMRNAFESIHEKSLSAPKGYEPRVVISTRKLPRFVQIRIKDNGMGITDKVKDQIFEPFYSTKSGNKNPGLGLSESRRIINGKHKGELYIESDITSSTDFIIRFPTLTLM